MNIRRPSLRITRTRTAFVLAVIAAWVGAAGPGSALLAGGDRASAASAPSLGGWNVTADGNTVDILVDNTTGLAGVHPFSELDFPEAQSQFATGPFGSGLATIFYPGSAGANFGSLSSELGIPSELEPLVSEANDPVVAASQYPTGPDSARYPSGSSGGAVVMESTAGPGGTTAEGAVSDESPSTLLGFSSVKGASSALASSTATAQSSSDLSGVALLGGLIDIGSISSTANATSNGSTGTGSAQTTVGGVTVLGQAASLSSSGLTIPDYPSTLGSITGPIVANAVSQVISGLGLTVKEFPSTNTSSGAGYSTTSGGVSIEIDPPSSGATTLEQAAAVLEPFFPSQAAIIPTLPGLLQGLTVTMTLGRATASADASAAFNTTFTPPAVSPGSGTTSSVIAGTTGTAGSPATPGSAAVTGSTGSASASPALASPSGPSSSAAASPPTSLIRLSSPLGVGAVVLGILATLALGFGLMGLARKLLPGDVAPVCPLGQDHL